MTVVARGIGLGRSRSTHHLLWPDKAGRCRVRLCRACTGGALARHPQFHAFGSDKNLSPLPGSGGDLDHRVSNRQGCDNPRSRDLSTTARLSLGPYPAQSVALPRLLRCRRGRRHGLGCTIGAACGRCRHRGRRLRRGSATVTSATPLADFAAEGACAADHRHARHLVRKCEQEPAPAPPTIQDRIGVIRRPSAGGSGGNDRTCRG